MKRKKSPRPAKGQSKGMKYAMRLYVTGASPKSTAAIANLRKLCDDHLAGQYELKVVDVYQQPELAREGQIIAAPTLVKQSPAPARRFIGDMSHTENMLSGLDLGPDGVPGG
jgi:circadian clock protein KaiB